MTGYIAPDLKPYTQIVIDWLYEQGLLKHKSYYNLTSMALKMLISQSIKEIQKTQSKTTTPRHL